MYTYVSEVLNIFLVSVIAGVSEVGERANETPTTKILSTYI
jgi:hypothetical protein